jgi:hypothetical protein
MHRIIFLDTEFTSFHRPYLLSLGMVSLDGAREFYAELDMTTPAGQEALGRSSEMVRGPAVLGQWGRVPGANMDLHQMCKLTAQWLSNELALATQDSGDARIALCSDYDVDFKLLVELLRLDRSWDRFSNHIHYQGIFTLMSHVRADQAEEKCFEELTRTRGLRQHHALADALAMRAGFMAMNN